MDLPCSEYDDVCVGDGLVALKVDAQQISEDPLFAQCRKASERCDQAPNAEHSFEDLCGEVPVFTDEGRDWLSRCLALPCDRIDACLHE